MVSNLYFNIKYFVYGLAQRIFYMLKVLSSLISLHNFEKVK